MQPQIQQLKTELREFIELSKKITPGKWEADMHEVNADDRCVSMRSFEEDATFIARSRNISPAMAECLLVAVDAITDECPHGCLPHCPHHREMEISIQQILTLWEASK
jgi:hypothetical protein